MKRLPGLLILAYIAAMFVSVGCKQRCVDCDWDWGFSHTPFLTVTDPVLCLSQVASTTTALLVSIRGSNNVIRANSNVEIRTEFGDGYIEPTPSGLFTTDSAGDVRATLHVRSCGMVIVSAISETGLTVMDTVRVLDCNASPPHYSIALSDDTVRYNSQSASNPIEIRVFVTVRSPDDTPVSGYSMPVFYSTGLIMDNPLPPTDSTGQATTIWKFNGFYNGKHYLTGCFQNFQDSVWVNFIQ
jgi:hypothetical protein